MPSPLSALSPPPRLLLLARPGTRGTEQKFPRRLSRIGSAPLTGINPFAPPRSCHTAGPSFAARLLSPFYARVSGTVALLAWTAVGTGRGAGAEAAAAAGGLGSAATPASASAGCASREGRARGAPGVFPEPTVRQPLNLFLGRSCAFRIRVSFFPEEGCEFHSSCVSKKEKRRDFTPG